MALPIAQLGYSPSMNLTTGSSRTKTTSPWVQMAAQMLGNIGTQGAENLMQRDYSQPQGNVPAPATDGTLAGGTTSDALPRDAGGNIVLPSNAGSATTQGVSSNGSSNPQSPPGQTGARSAPTGFWDKLMHGPVTTGAMNQQNLSREQEGRQFAQTEERLQGRSNADVLNQRAEQEDTAKYRSGMLSNDQLRTLDQAQANRDTASFHKSELGIQEQNAAATKANYESEATYRIAQAKQAEATASREELQEATAMRMSDLQNTMMYPQGNTPEERNLWSQQHQPPPLGEYIMRLRGQDPTGAKAPTARPMSDPNLWLGGKTDAGAMNPSALVGPTAATEGAAAAPVNPSATATRTNNGPASPVLDAARSHEASVFQNIGEPEKQAWQAMTPPSGVTTYGEGSTGSHTLGLSTLASHVQNPIVLAWLRAKGLVQ